MITQDKIHEILAKVDIVDVISKYIPLQKKGRNYVGICPFHEDTKPSMNVSAEKQIFKCFSCGTGGNAIRFIQKYKNISFQEAIQETAEMAGIELQQKSQERIADKRVYMLNKQVRDYANYELRTEEGRQGLAYLENREYTMELIDKQHIGVIEDGEKLHRFLNARGFTDEELLKYDILQENDTGRLSCKWESRILYPIENAQGMICGFTARNFDEHKETAKYVNSRESEIFHKRELFYNLSNAHDAIRRNKEVILMEGSVDVDQTSRLDAENCISTMGTAFNIRHLEVLKHYRVPVRLMYDGDAAGISATLKTAEILQHAGIQTYCVSLPQGEDPDTFSRNHPEEMKELLKCRDNVIDFSLKHYSLKESFEEKKAAAMDILKRIHEYGDPLATEHYIEKLEKMSGFSKDALQRSYDVMFKKDDFQAQEVKRFPKSEVSKKNDNKVLIKFTEKDRMIYKAEVKSKFDDLTQENKVLAFDEHKILNRTDILSKYIYQKGRVLETTITCLVDDIDDRSQSIAHSAVHAIAKANEVDISSLQYIGYLHKNTKYPHIHLQVWQDTPLFNKYKLTTSFLQQLKADIMDVMNEQLSPVEEQPKDTVVEEVIHDAPKL